MYRVNKGGRTSMGIEKPVPLDLIYTNELIPEINKFDREQVRAQAKALDISKL